MEVSLSIPVRRTRWTSFWIGVVSAFAALLLAVALSGLLLLLPNINGVVVIIAFGTLWFGLFFLSLPRQKIYARSRDVRRQQPGISLTGDALAVPVTKNSTLHFKLGEPHELMYGWCEHVMTSSGGPTSRTRAVWTHAMLSQAGQHLYLIAEDSIREAQVANWPPAKSSEIHEYVTVRLWASDLVTLVEALRARAA